MNARMRIWALLAALAASSAVAQDDQSSLRQAFEEARIAGPAEVDLAGQGKVSLSGDVSFVPRPVADDLMAAMGNTVDDEFVGLIWPNDEEGSWFVTVDYVDSGYISDDEAADWDTDELLESLRQGTKEANRWREDNGFTPIEVTGWVREPFYDPGHHHLVWSAGVKEVGASAEDEDGVNYNTYVLGRKGYLSLNLVTGAELLEESRPRMDGLLAATSFNEGLRYDDFDASSDHVAAYGIAALVGGIAAKKLGLLAVLAAFFVKAWKLLLIGFVGIGALFRKLTGRKNA